MVIKSKPRKAYQIVSTLPTIMESNIFLYVIY
jgi:hypothetical protein